MIFTNSLIERCAKRSNYQIYFSSDWRTFAESARPDKPFKIINLTYSDFFDFKKTPNFSSRLRKHKNSKKFNNWNVDLFGLGLRRQSKGLKVPWSEGKCFWLSKNCPNQLRVRDGYDFRYPWKLYVAREKVPQPKGSLSMAYSAPRGITTALKKDLIMMLERKIIPAAYRSNIINIPCIAEDKTSIKRIRSSQLNS